MPDSGHSPEVQKYRDLLVEQTLKSQAEYDRLVIALSGGAFGISFTFVDRIAGDDPVMIFTMVTAWVLWSASLACALWAHSTSTAAMRAATVALDRGRLDSGAPGGIADAITHGLNVASGALFVAGLLFVCLFTAANFGRETVSDRDSQSPPRDNPGGFEDRGARVPLPPPGATQGSGGASGGGSGGGSGGSGGGTTKK